MKTVPFFGKTAAFLSTALFAFFMTAYAGLAASTFEGTWAVQDTQGNAFQIVLSPDGKASGDRAGEELTGTWKAEDDAAVITWDTEWTTKISKKDDQYKKTAIRNGEPVGSATDAKKIR